MRVLMVGNDTSVVEGRQGKFAQTLEVFRRGWERVDVILPRTKRPVRLTQMDNVFFHVSPVSRALQIWFVERTASRLIEKYGHDLIALNNDGLCRNGLGVYWAWRKTGVPVISEIHHVPGFPRAGGWNDRLAKAVVWTYIRWARHHVAAFRVVNRRECAEFLMRRCGVPESQMLFVPSAYVDDCYYPRKMAKTVDLMFCGRLTSNKGLDLLLKAFSLVLEKRPNSTLLIKGEGPLESRVWSQARRLGVAGELKHVRWVEAPEDLARLYSSARVLVCSSYNEGGPRVTVEAMACGVPVVSTRVGIMSEVIRQGENGYLTDWDPPEIAQRCLELLNDPALAQKIGERGRDSVTGMTQEIVVGFYTTAYQGLVNRLRGQKGLERVDSSGAGAGPALVE